MVNRDRRRETVFVALLATAAVVASLLHGYESSLLLVHRNQDRRPPSGVAGQSELVLMPNEGTGNNVILTSMTKSMEFFHDAIVDFNREAAKSIENFAGSYRRINGAADIFVLSNVEAPAIAQEGLRRYNVTWLVMGRQESTDEGGTVIPFGNVLRHLWFRHVLEDLFPARYNRVLVADSRDVYFQADPFLKEELPDLTFTTEEEVVKRGDWFHERSYASGYTLEETEQYHGHMICAGVFLGRREAVLLFFKEIVAESVKRRKTRNDQHYIFHLIRQGKLPNLTIALSPAKEIAWHLKKKTPPTPEYFVNERGLITDEAGHIVPVLHHIHNQRAKNIGRYLARYRPPFVPNPDLAGVRVFTKKGKSCPAQPRAKAKVIC